MMKARFTKISLLFAFTLFLASQNGESFTITFNYTGTIDEWAVEISAVYHILCEGAQGGGVNYSGGKGASMSAEFDLCAGEKLRILVGESPPSEGGLFAPGGGGASFVALSSYSVQPEPLIVAGGGGGCTPLGSSVTSHGQATLKAAGNFTGQLGHGAAAAPCGGGGGGYYSNGTADISKNISGGAGFLQLGRGADASYFDGRIESGGFGGGATGNIFEALNCNSLAGAGGGYSGGAGNDYSGTNPIYCGNGGGSFNSGRNSTNTTGVRKGHGIVVITRVESG